MSARRFSDVSAGEFVGLHVTIPMQVGDRIVAAAEYALERQSRFIDPDADPLSLVCQWLDELERARTVPTPNPEPGDLLVKNRRGEQWVLTVEGWRELAPIELQADQAYTAEDEAAAERARATLDEMRHRIVEQVEHAERSRGRPPVAALMADADTLDRACEILREVGDDGTPYTIDEISGIRYGLVHAVRICRSEQ